MTKYDRIGLLSFQSYYLQIRFCGGIASVSITISGVFFMRA